MFGTMSGLPCLSQLLDQFKLRARLDFSLEDAAKYTKQGPEYHIFALSDRSLLLLKDWIEAYLNWQSDHYITI